MSKFLLDLGAFALKVADMGRVVYVLRGTRWAPYDHLTLAFRRRMWLHLTRRRRGGLEDRKPVGLVRLGQIESLILEFEDRLRRHFLANVRPTTLDDLTRRGYQVLLPADSLPAFVDGIAEAGVLSIEQFLQVGADHVDCRPVTDAKAFEDGSEAVHFGLIPPAGPDEACIVALYHFPRGVGSHRPGWFTYELGDFPQTVLSELLRKHVGVRFLDWLLYVTGQLGIEVDREGIEAIRAEWSRPG